MQINSGSLKFINAYPKVDTSNIFTDRYEVSYVLDESAKQPLASEILKAFPDCERKKEIIATTYSEPIPNQEPGQSCVIRYRQRYVPPAEFEKLIAQRTWTFGGPGNLEIKCRKKDSNKTHKMGSFLLKEKGKDIYQLLKLARRNSNRSLKRFISLANKEQRKSITIGNSDHIHLINPDTLVEFARYLTPYATRLNIRETFEISSPSKTRITLETNPAFYAYPIEHLSYEESPYRSKYEGLLAEQPDRIKLDIKSKTKTSVSMAINDLQSTISRFRIPKDKYSKTPYDRMVVEASKKRGVLIEENSQYEIEAKANVLNKINTPSVMENVRNKLLARKNAPYHLFITSPEVKVRGDQELNRTIVGWKDAEDKWHEVVTIIRLTKEGEEENGYSAILKWKQDSQNKSELIMVRKEKKEILLKNTSNEQFVSKLNKTSDRKIVVAGVIKKMKYRIIVQDRNGRNFVVSLDECVSNKSKKVLRQLEVEYAHTVLVDGKDRPTASIKDSCLKCMDYFIQLFKQDRVQVKKTCLRKIDFAGSS